MYEDKDEDGREEEEMLIRFDVGAAPLDRMFLYNLTVPFFKNRSNG